jgi:prepilin-type N-terminal cleavage/methylation domain-containing protein/prepilin-type processing-associated H-X9-DG protein
MMYGHSDFTRSPSGVQVARRYGFTLIELLVVIAIIALLLSIIFPALRAARETAKRVMCGGNLKTIGQGVFLYATENDDKLMPPISQDSLHWSHLVYRINKSEPFGKHITNTYGLAYLYTTHIVKDPKVFYCPSAARVVSPTGLLISFRYEDFLVPGTHAWPWNCDPSETSTHNVRSSFDYTPQAKDKKVTLQDTEFPEIARKASQLYPGHVLGLDALHTLDHLPHTRGFGRPSGVNVLFSDGHVDFRNNPDAFSAELWGDVLNDDHRFRLVLRHLAK